MLALHVRCKWQERLATVADATATGAVATQSDVGVLPSAARSRVRHWRFTDRVVRVAVGRYAGESGS